MPIVQRVALEYCQTWVTGLGGWRSISWWWPHGGGVTGEGGEVASGPGYWLEQNMAPCWYMPRCTLGAPGDIGNSIQFIHERNINLVLVLEATTKKESSKVKIALLIYTLNALFVDTLWFHLNICSLLPPCHFPQCSDMSDGDTV